VGLLYVAQGLSDTVAETCPAVCAWDDCGKGVSLLKIVKVVTLPDLIPGKAIGFAQAKFFEIGVNIYVVAVWQAGKQDLCSFDCSAKR
jgi:hypothetical protein